MGATLRARLWTVGLVLVTVATWALARELVPWVAGPPGWSVRVSRPGTVGRTVDRYPFILAPEIVPHWPAGSSVMATATLLTERAGVHEFDLGVTMRPSLRVDGQPLTQVRAGPGRTALFEVDLSQGLHALTVEIYPGQDVGGLTLGMRPPGEWRSRLLGPGQVVAEAPPQVAQRLGEHVVALCRVMSYAPPLCALLVLALALWWGWRRVDLHLLGFIALLLPLLSQLLPDGYYACHEEESYIVRLQQFEVAMRGGIPLGRWWPDPVLGRGYPMLCLYAPLLYLLAIPGLALGLAPVTILKCVSAATVIVAAVAIHGLARRRASREASLLAVALYLHAPYFNTDLYIRADLAETLGFATFPLALWALDVALDRRPAGASPAHGEVARLGLALALLGTSHNAVALFSLYFLGAWMLARLALRSVDRDGIRRALAGGGLGVALTLFFTLPAAVDRSHVQIDKIATGFYHYALNFVPPHRLWFAWHKFDMQLHFGIAATVAVLLCAAALVWRRREVSTRSLAVLALTGVLLNVIMSTRAGYLIYRFVPLARFVQFPWRLLLFGATFAALAGAAALDAWLAPGRRRQWIAAGLSALIACAWLTIGGPAGPLLRRFLDMREFLRSNSSDYVTSVEEYLPRTVVEPADRFDEVARTELPAVLTHLERQPGRYVVGVTTTEQAVVTLNLHWFPGWSATLDGKPIALGKPRPDGLARVLVPAGSHRIEARYGRTPLRTVCDTFSFLALAFALALLVRSKS